MPVPDYSCGVEALTCLNRVVSALVRYCIFIVRVGLMLLALLVVVEVWWFPAG